MKVWLSALAVISALWASDDQQLAMALRAQAGFDRVILAPLPEFRDAEACIQSQAAVMTVAAPHELPLFHFRKGYCMLAEAALTGDPGQFSATAAEFDQAAELWVALPPAHPKDKLLPVPSVLPALSSVARLWSGESSAVENARRDLEAIEAAPACQSYVASPELCQKILRLGDLWLGKLAVSRGDWNAAGDYFTKSQAAGWTDWVAGRNAFAGQHFPEAASHDAVAVRTWREASAKGDLPLLDRLAPPPDMAVALTDWGGAQILAKDPAAAMRTLEAAVKLDPASARAHYLQARANELAGHADAALEDYSMASRAAFAGAGDAAAAEAHFYRGIMLYRHKDLGRAEEEFNSALNLPIDTAMRPDAIAWKRMAAVTGGSCGASVTALEQSLPGASPYFPRDEARAAITACHGTASRE